jgi:hypothetical protein
MIEEFGLDELLQIGSGLFALGLFVISLLAYHRSKQNRILMVSASFFLYFLKISMQHIDIFLPNLETSVIDLLISSSDFVILLLFFLAIVKK